MSEWVLPQGKFLLELEMTSDWHVGSGAGRPGDIDRLIRRDPLDGLPFVPAKTITGIWRDACEKVAYGLDNKIPDGPWSKWVEYLFGEQPALYDRQRSQSGEPQQAPLSKDPSALERPQSAALSIRPAFLPEDLRIALQTKRASREAATFTKPGVAIHPRTGRARQDFLRFEEMGRMRALLTAECELALATEEDRKIATALLLAGAQCAERLGGKRRRGAGRCLLKVVGKALENQPQLFERLRQPPPLPVSTQVEDQARGRSENEVTSTEWVCLELALHPQLPLVIPSHTIGNLIETLDYIPGSYLLPLLSRALRAAGINVNAALANQALVITNAVFTMDGKSGRPVPFSIAQEKLGGLDKGVGVYNRLCEEKPKTEPTKSHSAGYVGDDAARAKLPVFDKPDLMVETHNVVKDEVQRPTAEVGGVYSYQAIAPLKEHRSTNEMEAVIFKAELRLQSHYAAQLQTTWAEALDGDYKIGRASKDDYGLVTLKAEVLANEKPSATLNTLTVWLLSDVLLRDERLRPSASIKHLGDTIANELNRLAGCNISLKLKEIPSSSNQLAVAAKQRRTDSWHVKWGFPRPTLAGLQAGSCAVFEVEGTPSFTSEHLVVLVQSGIGERRAEGYGQISFNDPLVTSPIHNWKTASSQPPSQPSAAKPLVKPGSSYEYAQLIECEAICAEIKRSALGQAANEGWRQDALGISITTAKPTMSQLGGFRSVVAQLQATEEGLLSQQREAVLTWLANTQQSRSRERAWPKAALWCMEELIQTPDRVWELLKIDFEQLILTSSKTDPTKSSQEERKQELWAEAVRTVVDACIRAHKRALEKESQYAA